MVFAVAASDDYLKSIGAKFYVGCLVNLSQVFLECRISSAMYSLCISYLANINMLQVTWFQFVDAYKFLRCTHAQQQSHSMEIIILHLYIPYHAVIVL